MGSRIQSFVSSFRYTAVVDRPGLSDWPGVAASRIVEYAAVVAEAAA